MKRYLICLFFLAVLQGSSQETKHFHHVLYYRWSEAMNTQKQAVFLGLFEGLPEKIEGLEHVSISKHVQSSEVYDIRIALQFTSKKILKSYQDHEDHARIVQLAEGLISDYAYFQFED